MTGQRSNQLNYVPTCFLTFIGNRVFSGFPEVRSIRLRRPFQPPGPTYLDFGTGTGSQTTHAKKYVFRNGLRRLESGILAHSFSADTDFPEAVWLVEL